MALRNKLVVNDLGVANELLNKAIINNSKYLAPLAKLAATNVADLIEKATEIKVSQLGTPVLDHITFYTDDLNSSPISGSFAKTSNDYYNNRKDFLKANYDYIVAESERELKRLQEVFKGTEQAQKNFFNVTLDLAVITVNRPRNILKQIVNGDDGTVKTYIANGDYEISINGIIAGTSPLQTDVGKIAQLDAMFSLKKNLKIASIYLNNTLGVLDVVVDSYNFTPNVEYGNLTEFSINLVSDREFYKGIEETSINF